MLMIWPSFEHDTRGFTNSALLKSPAMLVAPVNPCATEDDRVAQDPSRNKHQRKHQRKG
jgi:hypothetical protein